VQKEKVEFGRKMKENSKISYYIWISVWSWTVKGNIFWVLSTATIESDWTETHLRERSQLCCLCI
jgi:hypothetical protein